MADIDPIAAAIRTHVTAKLADVAAAHGVRVLLAIESGSRAWGFPSPDSDYDVRFIYAHPRDWYLQLADGRDVIEEPLDDQLTDLSGWDVKKALRLLLKSNPVVYEWLVSPVVYANDGAFRPAAQALFERHASPRTLAFHYGAIAQNHWQREIEGRDEVKLKRYFYVIRPLLSLAHVIATRQPPPMHMAALLDASDLPPTVRTELHGLIDRKRTTAELGFGPRLPVLDTWIAERLASLDPGDVPASPEDGGQTIAEANALFRAMISIGPVAL